MRLTATFNRADVVLAGPSHRARNHRVAVLPPPLPMFVAQLAGLARPGASIDGADHRRARRAASSSAKASSSGSSCAQNFAAAVIASANSHARADDKPAPPST